MGQAHTLFKVQGVIIETELNSDERYFFRGVEDHYKKVFYIGKGQHNPVTGL